MSYLAVCTCCVTDPAWLTKQLTYSVVAEDKRSFSAVILDRQTPCFEADDARMLWTAAADATSCQPVILASYGFMLGSD